MFEIKKMIPAIPDKLHKFIVLSGILLCTAGFLIRSNLQDLSAEIKNVTIEQNEVEYASEIQNTDLKVLESEISKTKDPFLNNEIQQKIIASKKNAHEIDKKLKDISAKLQYLDSKLDRKDADLNLSTGLMIIGLIFIMIGYTLWSKSENEDLDFIIRQNIHLPKYYKECQSCAREFNSLVKYGSEEDGKQNYSFCKFCYSSGSFTFQGSLDDFKNLLATEMTNSYKSQKTIDKHLQNVNKAERWKN